MSGTGGNTVSISGRPGLTAKQNWLVVNWYVVTHPLNQHNWPCVCFSFEKFNVRQWEDNLMSSSLISCPPILEILFHSETLFLCYDSKLVLITIQNYRAVRVGKDLWKSSSPTSLPRQGQLQQVTQGTQGGFGKSPERETSSHPWSAFSSALPSSM